MGNAKHGYLINDSIVIILWADAFFFYFQTDHLLLFWFTSVLLEYYTKGEKGLILNIFLTDRQTRGVCFY